MATPGSSNTGLGWNNNSSSSNHTASHLNSNAGNSNSNTNTHSNNNNVGMSAAGEAEEHDVQTRTMGLKVHYTFDKEAKINCLARCPQLLHIQTAAIDDKTTIGLVDLRTCIHVITEGSPEITNQDCDYNIYAVDYLEPDTPLVGYGLLSWTINSLLRGNPMGQPPKMVTGRVTKNLLGVFGGGNKETLEVRLRLSEMTRIHRPMEQSLVEQPLNRPVPAQMETVMTPSGHAEWTSFISNHPEIGQTGSQDLAPRVSSPAVSQAPPPSIERPNLPDSPPEVSEATQDVQRVAPTPMDLSTIPPVPASSSRPSSRTSNRPPRRRKPPTGRPRGRPRKKPAEGNTSGYEDGTEGEEPREEGPVKKRIKTTMVDRADSNPFSALHEPLRVTASNSSSLRNFRPIAVNPETGAGIQSQEIPRAPTPVPQGRFRGAFEQGGNPSKTRHESKLAGYSSSFSDQRQPLSPSQDDRSPEFLAPTPNFSEGSPLEIGSSPPIRRSTPFIRSSPPPSSPVLPPMPAARLPREASFTNHDIDGPLGEGQAQPLVEEEEFSPRPPACKEAKKIAGVPVQVYQIQDGPTGTDLVHIRSYTTPHPSSSAPAPPEATLPSGSKHDVARPQTSRTFVKKKKIQSQAPALPPPTPPTTDAAEKSATPETPTTSIDIPMDEATLRPSLEPQIESDLRHNNPQPDSHSHAKFEVGSPLASETREDSRPIEKRPEPIMKPMQPVPTTIDLSQDPVLQLALSFGMSEVPLPQPSALKPSPPISEGPLPKLSQEPELLHEHPIPQPAAKSRDTKPSYVRQPNRSQSAGPLFLPTPVPTSSEPSSLSKAPVTASDLSRPSVLPPSLRRAASIGPLVLPTSESTTSRTPSSLATSTPGDYRPLSDKPLPPSSPPAPRSNKNIVKKFAIKQRLEQAIINGEMPPFCSNCGAIETPTWRKIWVQEKHGVPEEFDFSEKPGRVTAVEVIQRDSADNPTLHRIVKKSLAPTDDRKLWQEMLLCNPCGIWLSKGKGHRPPDRWDKDFSRLGQERRRRGTGRSNPRPKKSRAKEDATQAHPVSEGYIPTDGPEPVEPSSPRLAEVLPIKIDLTLPTVLHVTESRTRPMSSDRDIESLLVAGSTHPRGNGTLQCPIDVEFDETLGKTKRLLFPSPRRDGLPKALSDVDLNSMQASESQQPKDLSEEKENMTFAVEEEHTPGEQDDLESLFRSPPQERPSTPPPNAKSAPTAPFKTPTRPTPSHRPITRSVSKSLRSVRTIKSIASPTQLTLQQTPTRNSGATLAVPGSVTRRRSPRIQQGGFEDSIFNTPISRRITQMLSEQAGFLESQDLDFIDIPPTLDDQTVDLLDFGNLLDTSNAVLNSPAKQGTIGFDYDGAANFWPNWNLENTLDARD